MKIVIIGCSQSEGIYYGNNVVRGSEWGSVLAKKMNANVYNFAYGGSTLKSYINRLAWAIKNIDADLYIIQETTVWRDTIDFNGFDNILNDKFNTKKAVFDETLSFNVSEHKNRVIYYDCYESESVIHLNPYAPTIDKYKKKIQAITSESNKIVNAFMSIWQKYIAHSTDNIFYDYCRYTTLIHLMLQNKNFVTFSWLKGCHISNIDPAYKQFINDKKIIKQDVFSFFKDKYGEEWLTDHTVDHGFHLDEEAHEELVNNYILPKLRKRQFIQ